MCGISIFLLQHVLSFSFFFLIYIKQLSISVFQIRPAQTVHFYSLLKTYSSSLTIIADLKYFEIIDFRWFYCLGSFIFL